MFNLGIGQETEQIQTKSISMESKFLGLRTAVYIVTDVNKAKEWYSQILGIQPYFDEPFYVGFNVSEYELGLMPDENPNSVKGEGVIVYWGVEDIEASYQDLIDAGATEHEKPKNVGGDLMVASVKDPWGNIFGIIYNPYFKLD